MVYDTVSSVSGLCSIGHMALLSTCLSTHHGPESTSQYPTSVTQTKYRR